SSGRMACALAVRAFEAGADTELWMGGCDTELPDFIPVRRFSSVSDLLKMTGEIDADAVLVPAALADFAPAKADGKIPSDGSITLKLEPVPKVLPVLCGKCGFVLGFKAESGLPEKELIEKARGRLRKYGLSAIVANDVSCAGKQDSEAVFITAGSAERISGSKDDAAGYILERVAEML
ncbi:MAG: bifunctional phosphopantothenoylcysteine decarboxylase/phosphopantothenate--cysteine ligase CoaBC, partial [Candidatus Methanomethylophilaceae archaeon]|nr:bifunctional phosphopantothenoylcysteine decarboxylase/phosphopantothenate--cysteine ligase CoaBC [Candidatus Methanomethylophilaceae archaeon]